MSIDITTLALAKEYTNRMVGSGGTGSGVDGGYYTPGVTQPTADTMQISFAPSKSDMPAVNPVTVNLPVSENSGQNVDLTGYAKEAWVQEGFQPKGNYLTAVPEGYAKTEDIPTKPEDIGAQPQGDYLTKAPVESVNGRIGAVQLDAAAVGARSADWMPTANEVGARPNTWTPTAQEVGADPKGAAASAVNDHNTNDTAHNDIRVKLEELRQTLTHFFNATTPETMDQISEIVSGIEANADLIAALTTGKVSVSSIVANLTTNLADRPLAASMGVELKRLIDQVSASLANYQPKGNYALKTDVPQVYTWALQSSKPTYTAPEVGALPKDTKIPGKTSDLTNDSGFQTAAQVTAIVQQQLGVIENGSY